MTTPSPRIPTHTRSGPVFVLGFPRSGTSLTCRLLLDHLGVNFGSESQFIVRLHDQLPHYGDLREDQSLRRLFMDMSRERFFERTRHNFGFVFDVDAAMASTTTRTYAGALRTVFEQFAASQGYVRWGDKTPAYSHDLPLIHALFPDAQYVHVIRDGRDAAASMFKTGFGAKTALEAAQQWTSAIDRIQGFGKQLPSDRFLEIRYEHLLANPNATLETVARYLGIPNPVETIAFAAERLTVQVRQDNGNKWRKGALPTRELECFEALAADHLMALGYPLALRTGRRDIGVAEAALWHAQGAYRRLCNTQYWSDNLYKMSLRVQSLMRTVRPTQSTTARKPPAGGTRSARAAQ